MENIITQQNNIKFPKINDILKGKIINREKGFIYLDLGIFGIGIIKDNIKDLKIGDEISAKVVNLENEEGYIEMSSKEADRDINLKNIFEMKKKHEIITVKIFGANKGGLLTEILGVPAFLPVSQLSTINYPKIKDGDTNKIFQELQKFIGKELNVQILDIDLKFGKLILSEKLKEIEKIKKDLKKYNVGDIVDGEITGLTDFGAFIKFGKENFEGLIHISELNLPNNNINNNVSQIVKIGDKVKAKILEIIGEKVFLSLNINK